LGSRGPQPKSAAKRQRRNRQPALAVVSVPEKPKPPKRLLKATRDRWATYWESDVAKVAQAAHLPIIERLFTYYDERERAYRLVRKEGRLCVGSQGQDVQHPMLKYMLDCDKEIKTLEDRLGLSPRGMLQMGTTFADMMKSFEDRNRALEADDDEDPRLQIS
jgi:P27 family predicted phage terminase small subunit